MKFHIIFIALILFILISTYSDKIVYKSKTGFPIVLKNNVCIYMTSSKNLNDVHSSMNINTLTNINFPIQFILNFINSTNFISHITLLSQFLGFLWNNYLLLLKIPHDQNHHQSKNQNL